MLEILLGGVAMVIAQIAKKLNLSPKLVAAILAYGVSFVWAILALVASGSFAIVDLATALATFGTIGTAAWTSAVGIYEILKDQIEKVMPSN